MDKFEKLMEEAIEKAEHLPGSLEEFYRGLQEMQVILQMRIESGKDECPEAFDE